MPSKFTPLKCDNSLDKCTNKGAEVSSEYFKYQEIYQKNPTTNK